MSKTMTKYQLDHFRDKVKRQFNPMIEEAELLVKQFLTNGADHWWKLLSGAGVPCGPINSISEAFALAESLDLNPIITINQEGEARKQVANPITFSLTPVRYAVAPPSLDEE